MTPMRRLIEAAKLPKSSPQEQRAQLIQQTKQAARSLRAQADKVIAQTRIADSQLRRWNQDWATEIKVGVRETYNKYVASAKEDFDYEREDNPQAVMQSVDFYDCVMESYSQWWDSKKDHIEWGDAHYRLEEYMDAHRKTEMSDDLSRLQAEYEMARDIQHLAGFGSIPEITKTLATMSSYLDEENRYSDGGWSNPGTTTIDLITCGIPVILLFCNTIAKL